MNKTTNASKITPGAEFIRYKNLTFEKNETTLLGLKYIVKVKKEIWNIGEKTSIEDPTKDKYRYAQDIAVKKPDPKNLIGYLIYGKTVYEEVWEINMNKQSGYLAISNPVLISSKPIDYEGYKKLDMAKIITDQTQYTKMLFKYRENGTYKLEGSMEYSG